MQTHPHPIHRLSAVVIPAALAAAALVASGALAQDTQPAAPAAIASDSGPYWLRVSVDEANLRSRADRNSLPVTRLDRGQVLEAVGSEYGWHRVFPPEGVFSFVSGRYVDQLSDTEGIVSVSSGNLRVRVGSELNNVDPLRTEVQTVLPRGTKVHIIGHRDEWLKIVPPEDVFFYIADQCVERITPEDAARLQATATRPAHAGNAVAATRPAEGPDMGGPWGQRLSLVEAAIESEGRKKALEQSWTGPIADLRPIAEQHADPAVARLAQRWISRLEQRIADQTALRAMRRLEEEGQRKQAQLDREMQQIRRARQWATSQPGPVARGQLCESFALRNGVSPPYRLVDPITRAVVAYLEFPLVTDMKPAEYLGLYVGVAGEKHADPSFGADVIMVSHIQVLLSRPVNPAAGAASASTPTRGNP